MDSDEKLALRQFGHAVRRARDAKGLSQEALAADADVDRSTIARIEAGGFNASLRVAVRLARALGVRARDLLP